jgi:hypothetical protein
MGVKAAVKDPMAIDPELARERRRLLGTKLLTAAHRRHRRTSRHLQKKEMKTRFFKHLVNSFAISDCQTDVSRCHQLPMLFPCACTTQSECLPVVVLGFGSMLAASPCRKSPEI